MKFHIITAMYNFSSWIEDNIEMLKAQSDKDFNCILIDDMSTDNTVECAVQAIDGDPRFRIVVNNERKYKARNVVEAIAMTNASDDDVIVMIDGDDRLADELVLSRLRETYTTKNCWMTYGSSVDSNGTPSKTNKSYPNSVVKKNSFRKYRWLAHHLKTFKYGLWKKIRPDAFFITRSEYKSALGRALISGRFRTWYYWRQIEIEDLHDSTGKFIKRVDDKAFTLPMLEMAGDKAVFIEEIMYIYNVDNERMSTIIYGRHHKKWPGRLVRDILFHKAPYKRLDRLD